MIANGDISVAALLSERPNPRAAVSNGFRII